MFSKCLRHRWICCSTKVPLGDKWPRSWQEVVDVAVLALKPEFLPGLMTKMGNFVSVESKKLKPGRTDLAIDDLLPHVSVKLFDVWMSWRNDQARLRKLPNGPLI